MSRRGGVVATLVLGFFLAVAALVTWPLLPEAGHTLRDAGDPALFVWTLHWLAFAATHDPAQLYAGPIFHGFPNPVTFTDTSLLPGLLLAPLWLGDNHLLFLNLLMLVTLALIGFTATLWVRALTGSLLGGVIGGLVCAVNSYTLAHLSHLNLLSAYLVPLALLALHRLFYPGPGGPSWRMAAGLALALVGQTLSSFYILAYLLIAVGCYLVWQAAVRRAVWRWPPAWRRRLGGALGLVGLVAAGVIVVVTAPYWETHRVLGLTRTLADNERWAARPLDYLSVSLHNRTYARLLPQRDPDPLFAGFTALGLAVAGLVWRRDLTPRPPSRRGKGAPDSPPWRGEELGERSVTSFYAALLVLAVVLTWGPTLALGSVQVPLPYRVLALLPGADGLRAPVRAMVLVNLCLGLFAGRGAARFLALGRPQRGRAAAGAALRGLLAASLVMLILVEQQVAPLALTPLPATAAELPAVYRWLAGHPDGGVLMEMPVGTGLRDPTVEGRRMLYQTWHGHPLVGGYSGFQPPTYLEIAATVDAQYSDFTAAQLGLLQSLDVRYLLYHDVDYKASAWQRVAAALARFPQVHAVGVFGAGGYGSDHLYRLDPRPADARLLVAVTVGPDGAVQVRLTNPAATPLLTRLRPTLDLATADGRTLAVATPLLLPPGSATFPATFAGPAPGAGTALAPLAPAPGYLDVQAGMGLVR